MEKRIPQLDGLRGLAAATVVVAHYIGEVAHGWVNLQVGWLAVNIFFVLSGFLIGGIILDDKDKPGFWRGFYLRRGARILPIYLVTVALILAMGAVYSPAIYLTFTTNMASTFIGDDLIFTDPLWTLAIEEQFYILLPVLMVLTPKRFVMPMLISLFVGALIWRIAAMPVNKAMAMLWLPARMDLLVAGVIAAWLHRNVDVARFMQALRVVPIVALFIAVGIMKVFDSEVFMIIGTSFVAVAAGAFILSLANGAPEFRAFLSSKLMAFFGTISFALYLLHQPINYLMHTTLFGTIPDVGSPQQWAVTFVSMGLSVLAAWVSWVVMERPILSASRRLLNTAPAKPGLVVAA